MAVSLVNGGNGGRAGSGSFPVFMAYGSVLAL
jgi:hypothetical protein